MTAAEAILEVLGYGKDYLRAIFLSRIVNTIRVATAPVAADNGTDTIH